jgi:hypothetical protein
MYPRLALNSQSSCFMHHHALAPGRVLDTLTVFFFNYVTFYFLFIYFLILLFICAYKAWVISPPYPLNTQQKLLCPYL